MGIMQRDGLNFHDGLSSGCIVIESERIAEYVKYIQQNDVKMVSLTTMYYKTENIDFFIECSSVESLSITSSSILDYSGLEYLKHLKSISLDEPKNMVDLSKNTLLEEVSAEYSKNILGIDTLKYLKTLKLWKYNPKSKNLVEFGVIGSLEELWITQSNITSLAGCGNMAKLRRLELNYLSKLEYIDEIEKNSNTLKSLKFDCCKKIKNHDYVIFLEELEVLGFNECGEIPSITFIGKMKKLKNFTFVNTNILDGDLSACFGLDYVGFMNKRHYSHKMDDFKKK